MKQKTKMGQAIILAAGFGSRLRPLTDTSPKCLLKVGGETILEKALKILFQKKEIENITIVTGYLHQNIEKFVSEKFPERKITLVENKNFETTNNAYSLYLALQKNTSPFLLLDGDLVFDAKILENLLNANTPNAIAVENDKTKVNDESMKAKINNKNEVVLLSKKLKVDDSAGEYIGLARFDAPMTMGFLDFMKKTPISQWKDGYYEDILNAIIEKQNPISVVKTENLYWWEIDTLDDLEKANQTTKK